LLRETGDNFERWVAKVSEMGGYVREMGCSVMGQVLS
jgi:hypothetical protein